MIVEHEVAVKEGEQTVLSTTADKYGCNEEEVIQVTFYHSPFLYHFFSLSLPHLSA